jgi:aminopeptidase N
VNLPFAPIPSLLRNFSAPVRVNFSYSRDQLAFLFAHDSDAFNRWEAGQRLATDLILEIVAGFANDRQVEVPEAFLAAFRTALADSQADPAFLALALTLPAEPELGEAMVVADPVAIHAARQGVRRTLAGELSGVFKQVMANMQSHDLYSPDPGSIGRRSLKNLCLGYLSLLEDAEIHQLCYDQYADSDNMTDRMAALACLVHNRLPGYPEALAAFYHRFHDDPLVVDKWFSLQATAPGPETLDRFHHAQSEPGALPDRRLRPWQPGVLP